jgi:hypothetical protein
MQELIAQHTWIFAILCGLPFTVFSFLLLIVIVLRKAPEGSTVLPKPARVAYWSCLPVLLAVTGFVVAMSLSAAIDSTHGTGIGWLLRKFAPYFVAAWVCFHSWLSLVSFAMSDDAYYVKRQGPHGLKKNLRDIAREFPAVLGWGLVQSLVVGGGVFIVVSLIKLLLGLILHAFAIFT